MELKKCERCDGNGEVCARCGLMCGNAHPGDPMAPCAPCEGTGFEGGIRVVTAVIVHNTGPRPRVLLTQRLGDKEFGWTWETPGGKVHYGESNKEALARELEEELGVKVHVGRKLWMDTFMPPESRRPVQIVWHAVSISDGVPRPLEAYGLGWFSTVELVGLEGIPSLERRRADLIAYLQSME